MELRALFACTTRYRILMPEYTFQCSDLHSGLYECHHRSSWKLKVCPHPNFREEHKSARYSKLSPTRSKSASDFRHCSFAQPMGNRGSTCSAAVISRSSEVFQVLCPRMEIATSTVHCSTNQLFKLIIMIIAYISIIALFNRHNLSLSSLSTLCPSPRAMPH